MEDLGAIEAILQAGKVEEAVTLLKEYISASPTPSDRAYYLLGNAFRKRGDWQGAINNYLEAMAINPDSPARNAYAIANEILDFYNKDMYNQ
ncbi:MAG: tetratricopeptide repeat protein [Bacteroidales bacterium]|nr:tetratricopeptide repeat protein [Bacteroidales bacterium]